MALQALLIVSTLGLLEKAADGKELERKSKAETGMRATAKERDAGFFFLTGFFLTWWLMVNPVSLACMHTFCSPQLSRFFVSRSLKIMHTALGERFNFRLVEFFHAEEWYLILTCMRVPA